MTKPTLSHSVKLVLASAFILPLLSACGSDSNTPTVVLETDQLAVVATASSDFTSGAHAVFSTESPFDSSDNHLPTISDLSVACHSDHFYRIERFNADNITRFAFSAPSVPLYQYSTMESDGTDTQSSNPYDLIFASDTKAYLLRYGSNTAWIVNPTAETEAEFKIGELDLSAYAVDANNVASMSSAVIDANGYLYITLERQQNFTPQEAYVAVFDTTTDTEIDVDSAANGLKGVPLGVKNPSDIEYSADNGLIYVSAFGAFSPPIYSGGILSIDPANNFSSRLVIDDGDATTHPYGQISDMEIVSATLGYFVGYAGWQDESLYRFDPSTGLVESDSEGTPTPVANVSGNNIGGLSQDADGQLWVSIRDAEAPGIKLLNATDGSVVEDLLPTALNPGKVAICSQPAE